MSVIGALGLSFIISIIVGIPISFGLGISSIVAMLLAGELEPLTIMVARTFRGLDSYPLMAIPLFMLSGELMGISITRRLIDLAQSLIGWLRGGLAYVVVLTSMFFGAITGVGVAAVVAIGSIMIPAMKDKGYNAEFAASVCGSSAVMGPIIPPSVPMVIYASAVGGSVSIAALFMAGVVPGVLLGLSIMIASYYVMKKKNYPMEQIPFTFKGLFKALRNAIWALGMPLIIVGGIMLGFFTATEAAAVAVVYAAVVGLFIQRDLKIRDLPKFLLRSGIVTSTVMFLIAISRVVSWILTVENVPALIANILLSISSSPIVFMLIVTVMLLIVGCFLDPGAAIIMLAPILAPIATEFGIHPIHFALAMLLNLQIGMITPPVGVILFVVTTLAKSTFERIVEEMIPFIVASAVSLLLVVLFPILSTWIPGLLGLC
ncbi:MAG: TRAP transporter large permease [bacterium]|jgi:C4-dicarboxylate transporter DctM subunit